MSQPSATPRWFCPAQADVLQDHQALHHVEGVIRVPQSFCFRFRFKGTDGLGRHGDTGGDTGKITGKITGGRFDVPEGINPGW